MASHDSIRLANSKEYVKQIKEDLEKGLKVCPDERAKKSNE